MNLKPELAESLRKIGFVTATEVQEKAIPELMNGRNLVVRAKTGTGKTAAFLVPIMQRMGRTREMEAVVLAPTRELAQQIAKVSKEVGGPLGISTVVVYGGASINAQMNALRFGANILVGTPGRILDLMSRGALKTDRVKYLVLDEADIMLDMGFIADVEKIIERMPHDRQMMLFSATVPREVVRIAERYSKDSGRITAGPEEEPVVNTIRHEYAMVPRRLKFAGLLAYIKDHAPRKAIIFARTKFEANAISRVLGSQGYNAILMHGGLTQSARERSLGSFRNGAQFLIATNIASRGLDIADVTDIINFDAPDDPKVYIHRVGRSARMGKEGKSMTIADPEQRVLLQDIEHVANIRMSRIELNTLPFETLDLPIRDRGHGHGSRFGGRGGRGFNRQEHGKSGFEPRNRRGFRR
ncbi:MAG: DEAD/DEAH box helicase [Candidatus Micrarchaeota archaeon]|nr:DEAD/DEAH box helicase [Candidatus Micrarchaeota archaeon]